MKRPGNDTFRFIAITTTHHGMSLATSCLSICKNGAVISFKYIINKGKGSLFIYVALKGINTKDAIKTESFGWLLRIGLQESYLVYGWIDLYNAFATFVRFMIPRYFYLVLIGLHLTITFTASVISLLDTQIRLRNLKFLLLICDSIWQWNLLYYWQNSILINFIYYLYLKTFYVYDSCILFWLYLIS